MDKQQFECFTLSPLDGRYAGIKDALGEYFSEYALVKYRVFVEIQWLKFLIENVESDVLSTFDKDNLGQIEAISKDFNYDSFKAIKDIEAVTRHDVKAVEYFIGNQLKDMGYSDNDIKNVLYAVDFSEMKMTPISENLYLQKLIPVVEMNNQIIALQGNALSDGSMNTFLETITKDGDFKQISIDSSKVYSTSAECSIIYIDSDNEYLYVLERAKNNSDTQYFLNKYDLDFICVGTIDITSIFRDYEITDNIGVFYAFDNYFCITDYSGVSIVCKYIDKEIEMLLCEANLEYIPNSNNKTGYELFYLRNTNDIYRLNKQTGALEIQNYSMENEQFVIRCVLSYDNMLMISKYSLSETDTKDKLYLVPFTDNSLSN